MYHLDVYRQTSAAQRSGLTTGLDLLFHAPKGSDDKTSVEGAGVVTAFLPVNGAFEALPKRLQFFLFSPFGERALKKLLQFHVVPDIALLSGTFHDCWLLCTSLTVTCRQIGYITPHRQSPHRMSLMSYLLQTSPSRLS